MTRIFLILVSLLATFPIAAFAADAAKDARIVETLLRLKTIDVNARPDLKQAALRHIQQFEGSAKYIELVERLKLRGVEPQLMAMALADPEGNVGVNAARLLVEQDVLDPFREVLAGGDDAATLKVVTLMKLVGAESTNLLLEPLVEAAESSRAVRTAAASGLGRNLAGQRFLLELVENGTLHADLNFTVANALFGSIDPKIQARAQQHLELPAAADSSPLPPLDKLVTIRGDAVRGRELFMTKATCAKCHKVTGEGKEVGPDLSEIGSKLSPEAFYVSILDPSAGISHNYETYNAILDNGTIVSGILVSRTDDAVTLRTAEAIDKSFATDEIDEIIKSPVSLMPADLQKTMTVTDLVDVVEFLKGLKKVKEGEEG